MFMLDDHRRPKVLRTRLYKDQEFSRWELEVLHTTILQRLYNLKQLGWTDRIFPDATHSRFQHILGVAEIAEQIARRTCVWLDERPKSRFNYAVRASTGQHVDKDISAAGLSGLLRKRVPVVRLMGLTHDVTHAAFGHTLEDEVHVVSEKHDNPQRQQRFFDAIVAQIITVWAMELDLEITEPDELDDQSFLIVDEESILNRTETIKDNLAEHKCTEQLLEYLFDLDLAMRLLLPLDRIHQGRARTSGRGTVDLEDGTCHNLLIAKVIKALGGGDRRHELEIRRDMFLVDIVGNTICADLIDYARRDAYNCGLKVDFDDRIIRYAALASVRGELSPDGHFAIRSAIQFFTNKMRYDVLTDMSAMLKARYTITERALFHPTKCAGGAMLGTAIQLLGMRGLPPWMQVMGDDLLIHWLRETGRRLEKLAERLSAHDEMSDGTSARALAAQLWAEEARVRELVEACLDGVADKGSELGGLQPQELRERARAARLLLWKLCARRWYKLAYRLRSYGALAGGHSPATIADKFSDPSVRFALERKIESQCNVPLGSVVVHCPKARMSMKAAHALVMGNDPKKVDHLRNLTQVTEESLEPYKKEIVAIEDMYKSIWQLHVYIDTPFVKKRAVVAYFMQRETQFSNDPLLQQGFDDYPSKEENEFDLLAGLGPDDIGHTNMPLAVQHLDGQLERAKSGSNRSKGQMVDDCLNEVRKAMAKRGEADTPQAQLKLY